MINIVIILISALNGNFDRQLGLHPSGQRIKVQKYLHFIARHNQNNKELRVDRWCIITIEMLCCMILKISGPIICIV